MDNLKFLEVSDIIVNDSESDSDGGSIYLSERNSEIIIKDINI